jgi:ankyrin repeat protein
MRPSWAPPPTRGRTQAGARADQPDDLGQMPLYVESNLRRPEITRLLLEAGAMPTSAALSVAALRGDLEQVRIFLARGVDR